MKEKNASASEQKVLSILLNSQEKMTVKQILADFWEEWRKRGLLDMKE